MDSAKVLEDKTGRDMLFISVEALLCATVPATSRLYLNRCKIKTAERR